jgi:hypothetical protein
LGKNQLELKREDFVVEDNTVFTVDNILSPEECDYYVEKTNKEGYQDLLQQYEKDYRGNEM